MRLNGPTVRVSACHCTVCQLRTGSAFGVDADYAHTEVSVEGVGTAYMRMGAGGRPVEFHFCPRCGSTVFWLPAFRPHLFSVELGCLAGEKPGRPRRQAYEGRRLDWVTLDVGDQGGA